MASTVAPVVRSTVQMGRTAPSGTPAAPSVLQRLVGDRPSAAKSCAKAMAAARASSSASGAAPGSPSASSVAAGPVAVAKSSIKRSYSALLQAFTGGKVGDRPAAITAPPAGEVSSKIHKALEKASAQSRTEPTAPETISSPCGKGVMLNDMASHMVRKLSAQGAQRFARNMDYMPEVSKLASACSGTESWYDAMSHPFEIIGNAYMKNFNFEVAFVCEKTPMKQNYLINLPHIASSNCCCFDNVMDLKHKKAYCVRHDDQCEVADENIFAFACGFSCCPYSTLNPKSKSSRGAVARADAGDPNASEGVDTALGNFEYISKARPLMSFMENVAEFDDEPMDDEAAILRMIESNMAFLRSKFEDDGFLLVSFLVNSLDYALPQNRKRVYLAAIPLDHELLVNVPTPMLGGEIELALRALVLPTRALSEFLLEDGDPCLVAELERLQECKANAKNKLDKDTKWQEEHQRVFKQHGHVWGRLKPIQGLEDCPWFQAAQPREKDILTLLPHIVPGIKRCDFSQGITRCRPSAHPYASACTPGMKIFDFERMRAWVGRECLKLQGIDWENIPNLDMFSENDLNDLGGNAFASTCIMAVILSTFSTLALGPPSATMTDGAAAAWAEDSQVD